MPARHRSHTPPHSAYLNINPLCRVPSLCRILLRISEFMPARHSSHTLRRSRGSRRCCRISRRSSCPPCTRTCTPIFFRKNFSKKRKNQIFLFFVFLAFPAAHLVPCALEATHAFPPCLCNLPIYLSIWIRLAHTVCLVYLFCLFIALFKIAVLYSTYLSIYLSTAHAVCLVYLFVSLYFSI